MMLQMFKDGADPEYITRHRQYGFYSARISLKNWERGFVVELLNEVGPRMPEWDRFILLHDEIAGVGLDLG